MKKYFQEMMSETGRISLMRNIVFITIITACACAIANIFITKDITIMVVGMFGAAGVSKGLQSFAER